MRVVGVDPSLTCTGVCIIDEAGTQDIFSIKTKAKDGDYTRQVQMVEGVREVLQKDDVMVMEDFAFAALSGVSGKAAERLEICGMLKLLAPRITGYPFLECRPSHLKMFGTGKASSPKSRVIACVRMDWEQVVANSDEADAFILAKLAFTTLYRPADLYFGTKKKAVDKFEVWKENPFALHRIGFLCPN